MRCHQLIFETLAFEKKESLDTADAKETPALGMLQFQQEGFLF